MTKMNLFRRLSGLPVKKQTVRKKSRKTKTRQYKKKPSRFQQGWETAQKIVASWNSQPNPPKVYVLDRRVHHGEVGFLAGLAGLFKNDPFWTGFGARLAIDDIHDANEWFTFKKKPTFNFNNFCNTK